MRISSSSLQHQTLGASKNGILSKIAGLWVYALVAILFAGNIALGIALYKTPLIADALSNKSELQITAYENRIAYLRTELDRLNSRQHAKSGDLNLQLQELAAQQEMLIEQHDYVRDLATKAKSLGLDVETSKTSSINALPAPESLNTANITEVTQNLAAMQTESLSALKAIAKSATASSNTIAKELKRAGLSANWQTRNIGGPLLPAQKNGEQTDHIDVANLALSALSRLQKAKSVLEEAPIFRPVSSKYGYSSRFGNRRDPFTGKQAFHSGLDFRVPRGVKVHPIGKGKVTFVGQRGGYGKTVEITHSNGVVSRYAHLSSIRIAKGKWVTTQSTIGLVGSTGRSTGPHLHLEIRQNDKPLNPERFMRAGQKLAKFL